MPRWSHNAMTGMADLINMGGNSADAVATLRNLVNQWADANAGRDLAKTFSDGLKHPVTVSISGGEVMRVEVL